MTSAWEEEVKWTLWGRINCIQKFSHWDSYASETWEFIALINVDFYSFGSRNSLFIGMEVITASYTNYLLIASKHWYISLIWYSRFPNKPSAMVPGWQFAQITKVLVSNELKLGSNQLGVTNASWYVWPLRYSQNASVCFVAWSLCAVHVPMKFLSMLTGLRLGSTVFSSVLLVVICNSACSSIALGGK